MNRLFLIICMLGSMLGSAQAITRTTKQEEQLKQFIVGIEQLARDASAKADLAEKEAAASRAQLDTSKNALVEANASADNLQKAIDLQTKQLEDAKLAKLKAEAHDAKTTKENNFLKTILGIEAALLAILLCLWLKVPNLSPPWGLVATIAAPVVVFGLVKLIL